MSLFSSSYRLRNNKRVIARTGIVFRRKYKFHEQRFILRDTNAFEVCKLIPWDIRCCTGFVPAVDP